MKNVARQMAFTAIMAPVLSLLEKEMIASYDPFIAFTLNCQVIL